MLAKTLGSGNYYFLYVSDGAVGTAAAAEALR